MTMQAGTYNPVGIKFCIQDVSFSLSQGTNLLKPDIVGKRIIKPCVKEELCISITRAFCQSCLQK